MDNAKKDALLARFRSYLEEIDLTALNEEAEQTDLFSLFIELAALKNEVKLESRQVKTALDEFRDIFVLLRSSHEQLSLELEQARNAHKDQRRTVLRPVLLELLELQDRLQAGLQIIRNQRGSKLSWLHKRKNRLLKTITEAQEISLRRLQHLLATQQVNAIDSVGRPLDPHTMRVVEVVQRADLDHGVVVEELHQGFYWQGELLRSADVKVNKQE